MVSKAEIKEVKSLGQKKFRDELGLFVVEGEKLVEEALDSGFEIVSHYRIEDIGEEAMSRMSQLAHPSPALAVVRQRERLGDFSLSPDELVLALDGIRDPGNLGTIIRIADWFGIKNIIASEDTVELYNPKVVQATMGAVFRVGVHYCRLETFFSEKCSAVVIYGTFLDGENIYDAQLGAGGVIVMGSEANGISSGVAKAVTKKLFIPSYPQGANTSESLNVAVAAAITCSEFRRRLSR